MIKELWRYSCNHRSPRSSQDGSLALLIREALTDVMQPQPLIQYSHVGITRVGTYPALLLTYKLPDSYLPDVPLNDALSAALVLTFTTKKFANSRLIFAICSVPLKYNCSNPLIITYDPTPIPERLTVVPLVSYSSKSTPPLGGLCGQMDAAWLNRLRSVLDTGLVGKKMMKRV